MKLYWQGELVPIDNLKQSKKYPTMYTIDKDYTMVQDFEGERVLMRVGRKFAIIEFHQPNNAV